MGHDLCLRGCVATSLAGYLKALGVHRLVAGQADPEAQTHWDADGLFWIGSGLDRDAVLSFFLGSYAPTPIVTPWNGGSGFFETDQKSGIDAIAGSEAIRFAPYQRAIASSREVLRELGLAAKPRAKKRELLLTLRGRLEDEALAWLDAACVLGDEPRFPALLGSGGNDGRLEFANNFMQRVVDVLMPSGTGAAKSATRLEAALFGCAVAGATEKGPIGQFSPGRAGGPNMASGVEGPAQVNPWDYVLMLEGAVLLAAAAVRRLGLDEPPGAAAPFHVAASSVGYGSASGSEKARGEIWLPLWPRPAKLAELRGLFGEGRLELAGRRARSGVEAAQAVASLGVDRGIDRFQRFVLLERNGRSYFACPTGELRVRRVTRVDALTDLQGLLRSADRVADLHPGVATAQRRLEEAVFDACQIDRPLTDVLAAVGAFERAASRSRKVREKTRPYRSLTADWLRLADDGSPEYRLAAAFASWKGIRRSLEPVDEIGAVWTDANPVWGLRRPLSNIVEIAIRRMRECESLGDVPLRGAPCVTAGALAALLHGQIDEQRFQDLLFGVALVAGDTLFEAPERAARTAFDPAFDPAFAVVRAVTSPTWLPWRTNERHPAPRAVASILARLRAADGAAAQDALEIAIARLRACGVSIKAPLRAAGLRDPLALAAALAIPLPRALERRIIASVVAAENQPHEQELEVSRD